MCSHDIHDQISLFLKSFIDFCLFKSFHQLMQMFFCFCTFLFHEVDMSKKALEGQSSIHDLGEFLFQRIGPGHGVGDLYNFITYWRQMKLQVQNELVVYRYYPLKRLEKLINRPVSVKGRVVNNDDPKLLTVALDNQDKRIINVEFQERGFHYMFRPENFQILKGSRDYDNMCDVIYNEKNDQKDEDQNQYMYVEHYNPEDYKFEVRNDRIEPEKIINSQFFFKDSVYEFRGILTSINSLKMHEFTFLGDKFDLNQSNKLIQQIDDLHPCMIYR